MYAAPLAPVSGHPQRTSTRNEAAAHGRRSLRYPGASSLEGAIAKKKCPPCKKRKKGKCKKTLPDGTACAGGTCQGGRCGATAPPPGPTCTCSGGTCSSTGQCICPVGRPCSPGVCCPNGQACSGESCGACPVGITPCDVTVVCGQTSGGQPCACATSAAGVGRCVAATTDLIHCFVCSTDAQCDTALGLSAGSAVCLSGTGCFCTDPIETGCMLNCLTA